MKLVSFSLVLLLVSSCSALTRKHRAIAAAVDVTGAIGALVAMDGIRCEGRPPDEDPDRHDCDSADRQATIGMIIVALAAGAGLFLILDEQSGPEGERVGAPVVTVTPGPALPPLPEVETDAQTLQLAKQARRASVGGDCATARKMLASIAGRDAAYHAALVASPAVAGCPTLRTRGVDQ